MRTIIFLTIFISVTLQLKADEIPLDSDVTFAAEVQITEEHISSHITENDYSSALDDYRKLAIKYPSDLEIRNRFRKLNMTFNVLTILKQAEAGEKVISDEDRLNYFIIVRKYLYSRGIFRQALSYDQQIYLLSPDTKSAENIMETFLVLGMDKEASGFLSLNQHHSLRLETMSLLLKVRNGEINTEYAQSLFEKMDIDPVEHPMCMFDLARICCLEKNNNNKWATPLIYSLRYSGETNINQVKLLIMATPETQTIKNSDTFAHTINTPSRKNDFTCPIGKDCERCDKTDDEKSQKK